MSYRPVPFLSFVFALIASGCGSVEENGGQAPLDGSVVDGGASLIDAAGIDAAIVACAIDDDCQAPPSACLLPGTCNTESGTCSFPAKDCAELDGMCATGSCDPDTGDCVAVPANEDLSCGAGTTCATDGGCDFGGSICAETGTQALTCTDFTCQSGQCVASEPYGSSEACTRVTENDTCDTSTVSLCNACSFASTCAQTGSQSCTCTSFSCSGGQCQQSSTSCTQSCTRNTNTLSCGSEQVSNCGSCQVSPCTTTGTQSCTCTNFSCSGGQCQPSTAGCTKSCTGNAPPCPVVQCTTPAGGPGQCLSCCQGSQCSAGCCSGTPCGSIQ